jgi:hypothetical protein
LDRLPQIVGIVRFASEFGSIEIGIISPFGVRDLALAHDERLELAHNLLLRDLGDGNIFAFGMSKLSGKPQVSIIPMAVIKQHEKK